MPNTDSRDRIVYPIHKLMIYSLSLSLLLGFPTSPDEYLAFFSSTPTKYVWMYACNRLVSDTCSEDETDIQLLYNQDES